MKFRNSASFLVLAAVLVSSCCVALAAPDRTSVSWWTDLLASVSSEPLPTSSPGLGSLVALLGRDVQRFKPTPGLGVPDSLDWSTATNPVVVTPPKTQGMCDSCYCFAGVGAVEGALAIATNTDAVSLSAQQALDCSRQTVDRRYLGNWGCNTGQVDNVLRYALYHGLSTEDAYPYEQHSNSDEKECRHDAHPVTAQVNKIYQVTSNSEADLKAALTYGPVAVGINYDSRQYQRYNSVKGVIRFDPKDKTQNNHAVLLVGYGEEVAQDGTRLPFWKLKNSMGGSWGESGYFRLERGPNTLGVMNVPFFVQA